MFCVFCRVFSPILNTYFLVNIESLPSLLIGKAFNYNSAFWMKIQQNTLLVTAADLAVVCCLRLITQILFLSSCSPWMRAVRWASYQSKWFRPRLEKCCRELMLPNPASWRPGLRWTPGKEASLCFHPLKFCLFFFVFSVLMSIVGSQS